jgi:hypothetical protein
VIVLWSAFAHATGSRHPSIHANGDCARRRSGADSFHGSVAIDVEIGDRSRRSRSTRELETDTIAIARRGERRTLEPRRVDGALVELASDTPLAAGH